MRHSSILHQLSHCPPASVRGKNLNVHESRAEEFEGWCYRRQAGEQALNTPQNESLDATFVRTTPAGLADVEHVAHLGHVQAALSPSERRFGHELVECGPGLRIYGQYLSGGHDVAEDLVQETMLRAWKARAQFEPGTNLPAWTRTILRNVFLSGRRRSRFVGEWDDRVADRILVSAATQFEQIELADVVRALDLLSNEQREAVLLSGVEGLSIEDIAAVTGVLAGTVKSRVGRGRAALKNLLAHDSRLGSRSTVAHAGTSPPSGRSELIASQRLAAARNQRRQDLHARRALGTVLIG